MEQRIGAGMLLGERLPTRLLEAERVLGEARRLRQEILDLDPTGIALLVGPELRYEFVNRSYQNLAPGKPMTGRTFAEVWPEAAGEFADARRQVLETGEPATAIDVSRELARAPGAPLERRYFSFTYRRLFLEDGSAALLATVLETTREVEARQRIAQLADVAERRAAEFERVAEEARQRAQQLDSVFASLADGVVIYDADGRIVRWNEQAAKLLGYAEEDRGKSIIERVRRFTVTDELGRLLTPSEFPAAQAIAGDIVRSRVIRLDAPERPTVWVSFSAAPIMEHDRIVGAVATLLDVSAQHDLAERQAVLLRDVGEANRELAAISRITDVAIGTLELTELLDALLAKVAEVMGADASLVLLAENGSLRASASYGLRQETQEHFRVSVGQGFAGKVAETRRPAYIADAHNSPEVLSPYIKREGIRSVLGVPLTIAGQLIGVLHVDWKSVHPEDPREVNLLQLIADRIALAIRSAQLYEERRQSGQLSAALNEIDTAVNSTLEFDEIMRQVVERAAQAVHADCASLFVAEGEGWRSRFTWNMPNRLANVWFPREVVRMSALALEEPDRVVLANEVQTRSDYNELFVGKIGARAVLDVALTVGDTAVGDLGLYRLSEGSGFTDQHKDFARNLGASVTLALRNAQLYAGERQVADTLQRALLALPSVIEGIQFDCLYQSAAEHASVGGDFYDLFEIEGGRVGVMIGDVSGKGLAASTLTSLVRNTVRAYAYDSDSPATSVAKANDVIFRASRPEIFVTLLFGILDTTDGNFTYCNAGHPAGLVLRPGGQVDTLRSNASLVAAFPHLDVAEAGARIDPGDVLLLYTDGVIEARRDHELFGEARLIEAAREAVIAGETRGLPKRILERVQAFTGGGLADDVAMLAVSLSATSGPLGVQPR